MDLSHVREEYQCGALREEKMPACPLDYFTQWYKEGAQMQSLENAMSLATVDKTGAPSIRTVLLKKYDATGFVFFTNYGSDKAKDIEANPRIALLFFWPKLERQIIIRGDAKRISVQESERYFCSRPYESQVSAWCSHQSQVIDNREVLNRAFDKAKERFKTKPVPCPNFWGGYRVYPYLMEFWQGRKDRMHDRLRYKRQNEKQWFLQRLSP